MHIKILMDDYILQVIYSKHFLKEKKFRTKIHLKTSKNTNFLTFATSKKQKKCLYTNGKLKTFTNIKKNDKNLKKCFENNLILINFEQLMNV